MSYKSNLSKLRSKAGKKGSQVRWGGRSERANICVRVYPSSYEVIKQKASKKKCLPADIIKSLLRN